MTYSNGLRAASICTVVLADQEAGEIRAAFHGIEPRALKSRKRPNGMRLIPAG